MRNLTIFAALWFGLTQVALADMIEESSPAADEVTEAESEVQEEEPKSKATKDRTTCKNDRLIRKIWITYSNDQGHDCEVHYDKKVEEPGNKQILWSAKQNPDFCQQKAAELVERHKGWGWNCSNAN